MTLEYKDILSSLLPDGSALAPAEGLDLDKLLDGMGLNEERIREFLSTLADIRNPNLTSLLGDLEKEFGIKTNDNISDLDRRAQLAGVMYARKTNGSRDFLQTQLQRAGYNVFVYENAPVVDPDSLIFGQSLLYCGGLNATCGNIDARCGNFSGELIVNGDIGINVIEYLIRCGVPLATCGGLDSYAGSFSGVHVDPIEYIVPDGATEEVERWWNMIFFIGGEVTRNEDDEIIAIEFVDIPIQNRKSFRQIILNYKPMHSWAAVAVNWV